MPPKKRNINKHQEIGVVPPQAEGTALLAEPSAPAPTLAPNLAGSETSGSTSLLPSPSVLPTPPSAQEQPPPPLQPVDVIMEDEDMLLDGPLPLMRPVRTDKTLLAMRQQYKKLKTNQMRIKSHLSFIQQCRRERKIPKGLQVNVQCNAFLHELSNVKQQFNTTKAIAEQGFSKSLEEHYLMAKAKIDKDLEELEKTIAAKLEQANPQEKAEHEYLMAKTRENVSRHEERLGERKKKKLEGLGESQRRKPPRGQERQQPDRQRRLPYSRERRGPQHTAQQQTQPQFQTQMPTAPPPAPLPADTSQLAREIQNLRSMVSQLMVRQIPNQMPQQQSAASCIPAQQHPSLPVLGTGAQPRQHPSLSGEGMQQFFQVGDRQTNRHPPMNNFVA